MARVRAARAAGGSAQDVMRRYGAMALAVRDREDRRREVSSQLPTHDWPAADVVVVAVQAESGARRAFDRHSGTSLIDAVAASGTSPGVDRAIDVSGDRDFDGGMYSADHADLAAGFDRVLVLALRDGEPRMALLGTDNPTKALPRVEVVQPDDAAQAALAAVGGDVLDPRVGPAMATAPRAQGRRLAATTRAFWR